MDQGVAIVLAAAIALAGSALTGLAGVAIGGRISANAAKEAAKIAADAAKESAMVSAEAIRQAALAAQIEAQANREAIRQAQFADRIRELAAKLSHAAASVFVAVDLGSARKLRVDAPTWNLWRSELQLIVRRPETVEALDQLSKVVIVALAFITADDSTAAEATRAAAGDWKQAQQACRVALRVFEEAIKVELGVAPDKAPPPP